MTIDDTVLLFLFALVLAPLWRQGRSLFLFPTLFPILPATTLATLPLLRQTSACCLLANCSAQLAKLVVGE
jgi:hypothetical protein